MLGQVPETCSPFLPTCFTKSFGVTSHPASTWAHKLTTDFPTWGRALTLVPQTHQPCSPQRGTLQSICEQLSFAVKASEGSQGLLRLHEAVKWLYREGKKNKSCTQNVNSKTLCPLLALSRRDGDTTVTHVSVSSQSWRSPLPFKGTEVLFCSPHAYPPLVGHSSDDGWIEVYWFKQKLNRLPYVKICCGNSGQKPMDRCPITKALEIHRETALTKGWMALGIADDTCDWSNRLKGGLLNFMLLGKSFIMTIIPDGRNFRKEKGHFVLLKVI